MNISQITALNILRNVSEDITFDFLEKGKKAQLGEVRNWKGGDYRKTINGWVPVYFSNRYPPESKFPLDLEISTEDQFFKEGSWTKERVQQIHKPIIQHYIKGVKMGIQSPVVVLMMGAPASGKGFLLDHLKQKDPFLKNLPVIDPDRVKTHGLQDDFIKFSSRSKSQAASRVHEEGSYLTKKIMGIYNQNGVEYIQDKVFYKYDKLMEEVLKLKGLGVRVKIIMAMVPKEEAYKRMITRGEQTGRYVDEDYFEEAHSQITPTFDKFFENTPDNVISIEQYDTTNEIKLIKMKRVHTERFKELMELPRTRGKVNGRFRLSDEEIIFLAKEDLVTFADSYPGEAEHYMQVLD